ncbi:MAG: hypothetical protein S4CHLAM37_00830 [Chlamydiia bacterium]|nr:hypothetical protein [Chlamydiia bacterium]
MATSTTLRISLTNVCAGCQQPLVTQEQVNEGQAVSLVCSEEAEKVNRTALTATSRLGEFFHESCEAGQLVNLHKKHFQFPDSVVVTDAQVAPAVTAPSTPPAVVAVVIHPLAPQSATFVLGPAAQYATHGFVHDESLGRGG